MRAGHTKCSWLRDAVDRRAKLAGFLDTSAWTQSSRDTRQARGNRAPLVADLKFGLHRQEIYTAFFLSPRKAFVLRACPRSISMDTAGQDAQVFRFHK